MVFAPQGIGFLVGKFKRLVVGGANSLVSYGNWWSFGVVCLDLVFGEQRGRDDVTSFFDGLINQKSIGTVLDPVNKYISSGDRTALEKVLD
jgi:hypothetical protein